MLNTRVEARNWLTVGQYDRQLQLCVRLLAMTATPGAVASGQADPAPTAMTLLPCKTSSPRTSTVPRQFKPAKPAAPHGPPTAKVDTATKWGFLMSNPGNLGERHQCAFAHQDHQHYETHQAPQG